MNKKLAIKGHPTRGKEIIKLLEMMGGENTLIVSGYKLSGYEPFNLYYINDNGVINYKYHSLDKDMVLFTLEEFLEKYPFKVGDKVIDCYGNPVTIKSMSWHDGFETMVYDFEETENVLCAEDIGVANDMGLKIENTNMNIEFDLAKYSYEIKDGKLVVSEKTPKYPDNYEECVRVAKNIHGYDIHIDTPAYGELLESFVKLLICRDAYWKIAGEEMELGKPWVPNWEDGNMKFCMSYSSSWIEFDQYKSKHHILAFPTDELREAFYENFKDLIEECKELL